MIIKGEYILVAVVMVFREHTTGPLIPADTEDALKANVWFIIHSLTFLMCFIPHNNARCQSAGLCDYLLFLSIKPGHSSVKGTVRPIFPLKRHLSIGVETSAVEK